MTTGDVPLRLVVASKNPDKVREVREVLSGLGMGVELVEGLEWPDVEETGDTLEDNAFLKARAVADATGLPALADDTGLEVDALGGRPGVHSARYAGEDATYDDNVARLLEELADVTDRTARFRTVVAYVEPGAEPIVVEGVLEGEIVDSPRGTGGFGYDPVFRPAGDERTLAELPPEEKHAISHRGRALRAFAEALAGRRR